MYQRDRSLNGILSYVVWCKFIDFVADFVIVIWKIGSVVWFFLCLRSRCCRIWTAFFFLIIIIIIVIVVFARLHNRWLLTSTEINRGCHSWQGWICNFKVLSFITQKFQWLLWKDLGWLLVVFNFSKNQRQKFDEFLP